MWSRESGADQRAASLLLFLAIVLTALVYADVVRFQFVYDDLPLIVNNPELRSWAYLPHYFATWVWSHLPGTVSSYYRPLYLCWLRLNYAAFGYWAPGWHLTTVALHLVVVVLVYKLARQLSADAVAAAITAAVFALHPAHVESVAWVTGVCDSWHAVFAFAALLAYIAGRRGSRPAYAAAVLLYAAALLCKETAAFIPAVMLAYDWLFPQEGARFSPDGAIRRMVPFGVVAMVYLGIRHVVMPTLPPAGGYTPAQLALMLPEVLWFYLRHLLWPVRLSIYYDEPPVASLLDPHFWLPLIGVAIAVTTLVWVSRRSRLAAFASLWIAIFLLPSVLATYTFLPDEMVHDRYLYLPVFGIGLLLAAGLRALPRRRFQLLGQPGAPLAAALVILFLLAWGSSVENVYWANGLTLFSRAAAIAPRNDLALVQVANEAYRAGRPDWALDFYRRAIEIDPKQWRVRYAFGITLFELGKLDEAEAQLRRAIALFPAEPTQHYELGLVFTARQQWQEAAGQFRAALAANPRAPGYHLALGRVLVEQGDREGARREFEAELALDPQSPARGELERLVPTHAATELR